MRFKKKNWIRYFDGHNKVTTIRDHVIRLGHHNCYGGSYYHPEKLGELDITRIVETTYGKLTEQDAKNDGFDTLDELKEELDALIIGVKYDTPLIIHWTSNVKEAKEK